MSKVDNSLNEVCQKRIEDLRKDFLSLRIVFLALGDETRQLILLTLLEQELKELRVNEIAQHTYLSRPAVSHHLQSLKNAGLLQIRKEGTKNYYSIKKQTMIFYQMKEMFFKIECTIKEKQNLAQ
ncbi:metalloregulator ArsR/SmtB family transcription factor [Faecalicoccus pleomorphus]|uniref:ArsR/SmtB family transcription factor n=1 Tax=Faecalicoccus pleomorphus TaxID=1323 RepID=UPI00232FA022|nr:metalloregulator ArsR/SmtB family transcription factor [Faecalicoccus pleomorphus]MDB7986520.1 metalloregulator ArsR/SmtB family transcription factor [Faecalicoccus pleomorphus]MDB7990031.1 metalloregulator ArsR/SmtB family transcription factor [Faecalicoccus pleomorphus]